MDTPGRQDSQTDTLLIGIVSVLCAVTASAGAWAVIGLFVARTLALGLILLPLLSGCGAGLLIRIGRGGMGRSAGLIAILATLLGCVIGDFLWWAYVPNQDTIVELLTTRLVDTLNVLFNLQKAVMYFFACYLAYAISIPQKPYVSE